MGPVGSAKITILQRARVINKYNFETTRAKVFHWITTLFLNYSSLLFTSDYEQYRFDANRLRNERL